VFVGSLPNTGRGFALQKSKILKRHPAVRCKLLRRRLLDRPSPKGSVKIAQRRPVVAKDAAARPGLERSGPYSSPSRERAEAAVT
jgi:hypothetical protein